MEDLLSTVVEFGVDLLAGGGNMSMLLILQFLRTHNVIIDLVAWYPFRLRSSGELQFDSMAMFCIKGVQATSLFVSLQDIGLSEDTTKAGKGKTRRSDKSAVADKQGKEAIQVFRKGPGYPLENYWPKPGRKARKNPKHVQEKVQEKKDIIREMYTPAVAERVPKGGKGKQFRDPHDGGENVRRGVLKEKRLALSVCDPYDEWLAGGAHFPLWFVTENVSRRSSEGAASREEKMWGRRPRG